MTDGLMTGEGRLGYQDTDGNLGIVRRRVENAPSPARAWTLAGGTGPWAPASGGGLGIDSPGEAADVGMTHIT